MQGPWYFDKYNGLFHVGVAVTVEDTRFDTTSFWVQICWLQIRCMKSENAEAVGSTLGKVEYVEESAKGDCRGRCIQVQININITQLLCKGWLVNMGGPKPRWISFMYECMPFFCYWCGVMHHGMKLWVSSLGALRKEEQQHRAWMCAAIERFQLHQVVKNKEDYN